MKPEMRVQELVKLGYTPKEAEFLSLAALHSGYFLRRHFREFISGEPGGSEERFIERLSQGQHAQVSLLADSTQVFHLHSRPFYNIIGQPDNRHRRKRAPGAIQLKMMALDFALRHRRFRFLPTEQEKLEYFQKQLGIPSNHLPAKVYSSMKCGSTTRYFVDKFPVFLSGQGEVGFCYIDAAANTCSGFRTYLAQYHRLLLSLESFQIVYASARKWNFTRARYHFNRRWGMPRSRLEEIAEYFQMEEDFRARRFEKFDKAGLDRVRDLRKFYSTYSTGFLFDLWKREGTTHFLQQAVQKAPQPKFSTYHLEHEYADFGVRIVS